MKLTKDDFMRIGDWLYLEYSGYIKILAMFKPEDYNKHKRELVQQLYYEDIMDI